ncbi:MAG: response regulator transcription factor [Clostridiales bacterium]|nr:response regulator transcription factor [Clostridiales bacterium]
MNNKVLIVDDDVQLAMLLKRLLEREGIDADLCSTGECALEYIGKKNYHLVVLDVMLPGINGFTVLERLRTISLVPVLMLTAEDESKDKVRGLRGGADDYLTKPFNMDEFVARVQSLVRRYTAFNHDTEDDQTPHFQDLTIDPQTCQVVAHGKAVELPAKEFAVLLYLAQNHGRVRTKKQIYETVWEESYAYDDANLMGYISRIRKKIEQDPANPFFLQTVKGMGYRFNGEA